MKRITLEQISELPEREQSRIRGWINHKSSLAKMLKAKSEAMRKEELGVKDGQN